jgi:titin
VSWQTSYATSATINGLPVALSGTAQYTIATTTSYTIVASGAGGSVSATATVVPRIDCVQSDWSFQSATAWSACTGGTQTRTETWARSIITEPLGGGAACGPSSEQRTASQACSDPTPVAPGAPTNFRSSVSGSRVTLSWNVPVTGGAPLGYRLSVGTSLGGSNIVDDRNMGNVLSVSGDLPRGSYYARVLAYNGVGSGPYATEVSFRVGARSRLTSPLGFAASLQDGVAVLTWQPPACEQEDSPTKYLIEAGSAAGSTDLATIDAGPATSFQAAVPPGTYYVRVRAMNELGAGDASSEIVLRATSSRAPGAPAGVAATVAGAMVTLTWSAPTTGAVPASYTIEAGRGHNLADLGVLRVGNATRFTTTVGPGNYFVRVRAVAADGTAGDASEEIIVRR